jgi:CubicO group peptidase (beta-lactamase class C family)
MSSQRSAAASPVTENIPGLDGLVADAMAEWKIPGIAIAVVRNGEVALLKAYGQRDVEAELPVTTDTQFTICSITKSFTSTGLALLMDEGRLDWTKPVRDYVPEFRLQDAVATDRITVRDLLCHHSGLPRHDWIWMPADLSRTQMMSAMRYLEPSHDVRDVYQYNNLGYNAASIVTERISGSSWEEFIRTRLTEKLHMNVSFTPEDMASSKDAAVPYAMDGDSRARTQRWPIRAIAAGGINASITDIAHWLRFHLGGGEFEGQRLLSPALIRQLQLPRVHAASSEFAEIGDSHYGLGLGSHLYRGERVVGHSGGWIGWGTLMTMLPEHGIGVAVFTNRDPSGVTQILTYYILDRLCGKEPVPWFDRFRELRRKFLAQLDVDRQTRKAVRRADTRPSHDLAEYAGAYEHPAYGRIAITQDGDGLHWAYRGLAAPLEHRHYDTFELPEIPHRLHPDRLAISFAVDRDGNIASLSAPFEPMVKDIVFVRVAAGEGMDEVFRKSCVGRFSHGAMTHVVAQDADGQLLLTPSNQPTYRLRPYQGRIFRIVELEGFRVEFRRGPEGTVDDLIFHQPNGTFLARRSDGEQSEHER